MKKTVLLLTSVFVLMLGLVGCSSSDKGSDVNVEMRTVTDVKGEVEIPVNPKRIVDISGASDILSILGYDVIGTANSDGYDYTKFPTYLEDVLGDAQILGYSMLAEMDVEAIIALEPDLIVISTVQEKMYDQLSKIAPILYNDMGLAKPAGMPQQENISLPVVSLEGLAEIDADYIFAIGTDEDLATLTASSIWNGTKAVKEGNVVTLPASPYFNQGYSPIGRLVFVEEVQNLLASMHE